MNHAIGQLLGYTSISLFWISLFWPGATLVMAETTPTPATTPMTTAEAPAVSSESTPSQPTSSSTARVGSLDPVELRQLALVSEAQPQELVWLEVRYPEQEQSQQVLALEQKPRSLPTRGAVLLLHDKGQHANWPYVIRSLRMSLPDFGWYTLAVSLPYDDVLELPSRSLAPKSAEQIILTEAVQQALQKPPTRSVEQAVNAAASNPDPSNNPAATGNDPQAAPVPAPVIPATPGTQVDVDLAEKQQTANAKQPSSLRAEYHLQAAMNHLRSAGHQNIVIIGYRAGADLALNHLQPIAQSIPGQGFALVLIDPILQPKYQVDIAQALGQKFKAPVLDISNEINLDRQGSATERQASARMAGITGYQQLSLITDESDEAQQTLVRRVRLWLEKYASPSPTQR